MKKRIYRNMLLLVVTTIILSTLLTTVTLYRGIYNRMQQEVRNEAFFLSVAYNNIGEGLFTDLAGKESSSRVTWINSEGRVLFDNVSNVESMENHSSRPEVFNALRYGYGEAVHQSKTLDEQTFYRAIKLNDGTVIRVSSTFNSVYKSVLEAVLYLFIILLPVIILIIIIANKLTKNIIEPLNNLNLEEPYSNNNVYDELSPLLHRMAKQNDKLKKQYIKLKEQEDEFKTIIENVREGIIVLNNRGYILSINRSAEEIFSLSRSGNTGKHILALNRSKILLKAAEEAMDGNSYEAILKKDNRKYNILSSPVYIENYIEGIILLLLDITEKEERDRMRREFSANVSHELKTPLTSIIGYSELMKNGIVKEEDVTKVSKRIYNESKHLISLIDDIIRLSKLDEKESELPLEEIDLYELANQVIYRLDVHAKEKNINVTISGESAVISGVKQILEEVIYNIIDNAIKYNNQDGSVNVNVRKTVNNIILSVEDTGIGIPAEDKQRIFERFYRVDKSHSKDTGGTGLGLSIVRHGAEFHNAKIELQSELDKGSKIKLLFQRK